MFSDIFQIISVKCSNASKYIFQVRKLEKLVFFTATMTVFLKLGKIKIFSCNAFTILNVTKLCILEKQKLTKKDHGQQWPKVSYYVVTFYLFPLFYSLLGANCEEHLAYLRTKSVPRYNFFCSSFGILFIFHHQSHLPLYPFRTLHSGKYHRLRNLCHSLWDLLQVWDLILESGNCIIS